MSDINECIANMAADYLERAIGGKGFVRPVLGNYKNSENGPVEAKGTCTLVKTEENYFAVTATHVLDYSWDARPYILDKEGKPFALGSMLWMDFVDPTHGGGYDLSWSLLEPKRHSRLGLDATAAMLYPHLIGNNAIWALAGVHLKKNRVNHLANGNYHPSVYRTMNDAPRARVLAQYPNPTYESKNIVELPFDRNKFTEDRQPSPRPKGLSGGPSIYLGSLEQCLSGTMSESPGVFGFLVSQSDDNGMVCLASADMLRNLSAAQIKEARAEEARLGMI